ncbi:SusC/RagA family TonB-linked outer membrane protein [Niabella ginsengisoli]|uniref:SusC/RagA family TonB-linked outer membrane protein n=1 Tax=Niabella ginsengisoli TaxID=522298 RepID=A0ABS9SIS8_9BACT|nr:SusC/RagA family TonB-linked outer membrane protein [Niabella ginsengisoli]MCH5598282.1 SusC/RagA family TonB-linked outer membrane protein [Niabella ginsengisoli]
MYKKLFGLFSFILLIIFSSRIAAQDSISIQRDTIPEKKEKTGINLAPVKIMQQIAASNLPVLIDGKVAGVTTVRKSGEPGVPAWLLLRGLHAPVSKHSDIYSITPLYIVDGVPLMQNHSFAFGIKQYDYERIGSETDITTALNINDIESIEVLKDPADIARYGVQGVDGVVLINSKKPVPGKYRIGINMYGGIALSPQNIQTANGRYERDFRKQFYDLYANAQQRATFPSYLADSSNTVYYGPADWDEVYYQSGWQHSINAAISGGTERAFFRLGLGNTRENGIMRNTGVDRYNVSAHIGMVPFDNFSINTRIQLALTDRSRNTFLRERFAEQEYVPSSLSPLSPNKEYLTNYYDLLDRWSFDKNQDHFLSGSMTAAYQLKNWNISSFFLMNYHDNNRDLFYPTTINDGNNFASYFIGLDKRTAWKNSISYQPKLGADINLELIGGANMQWDRRKYDYIKGYRGGSDFVKIIAGGSNPSFQDGTIFAFKDYLNHNLISFSAQANLTVKEKYEVNATVNREGSSFFQNGYWWFTSPSLGLAWHLNKELDMSEAFTLFKVKAGAGRSGRLFDNDNYGYGPVYTVDNGYNGAPFIPSYGSIPTLTMPFNRGYTGWGIQWPYADQANAGFEIGINNKWYIAADFYLRQDKNLVAAIPVPSEYGFTSEYKNGLSVKNSGIELNVGSSFGNSEFNWKPNILLHWNQNRITALPDGLDAILSEGRQLKVGERVDAFWLLQNEGIYESDAVVPLNPATNQPLTYYGVAVKKGDPRWEDTNGDFNVDDQDRSFQGNVHPKINGAFNQAFSYKNWELNLLTAFATGKYLINEAVANRFDFVNRETSGSIEGVKEISFWTQIPEIEKYSIYNPWSLVRPYQRDQSLFLEKADYLKLKSVILSYNMKDLQWVKRAKITSMKAYITANNLFTITSYSGRDPELANYMGYDDGYGVPFARSVSLGLQLDF